MDSGEWKSIYIVRNVNNESNKGKKMNRFFHNFPLQIPVLVRVCAPRHAFDLPTGQNQRDRRCGGGDRGVKTTVSRSYRTPALPYPLAYRNHTVLCCAKTTVTSRSMLIIVQQSSRPIQSSQYLALHVLLVAFSFCLIV